MVDFLQRSGLLSPRFENVSMDPNAPQDVNPTGITVKDYAHRENQDGIPLDELRDLLGVKQQTFLAETTDRETEWRYRANGGYTASLYEHSPTSQIIHVSDFLRVTCTRNYLVGGVPTTDTWVFRTNSDNWFSLTAAAAGDTLVSEMTGILLRSEGPDNDYVPATIYIGRTDDNEILIQTDTLILPINHPEARMTVRFEFETYAGGLLGRRIAELRAFNPQHRLVFKRNSNAPLTDADVPATTDITYDGQTITIAASSDWVLGSDADPSGSGTLYYAATTASFDQVFGTWTVNADWLISSTAPADTSAAFAIQFSESESSARHLPRAEGDNWVWMRKPDGSWSGFPFDQQIVIPDRNWRTLATWTVTSGDQPYTGYLRKVVEPPLVRADYRFIHVHFRHYTEHHESGALDTMDVVSPQNRVAAGAEFPASGHDNIVVGFPETAAGFIREDDNHPGGTGFRFSMAFERQEGVTASDTIHSIILGDWITSTPAVITVSVY